VGGFFLKPHTITKKKKKKKKKTQREEAQSGKKFQNPKAIFI
jgi:hypothetical protein